MQMYARFQGRRKGTREGKGWRNGGDWCILYQQQHGGCVQTLCRTRREISIKKKLEEISPLKDLMISWDHKQKGGLGGASSEASCKIRWESIRLILARLNKRGKEEKKTKKKKTRR